MNEKQKKVFRLGLKALAAVACVFALIGSIGLLATIGKLNRLLLNVASGGSSSSLESLSAMSSLINIYPLLDLARFGGFAAFLITLIYAATEVITHSREKTISVITAASSVLGFVGCFLTSITAMYNSAMSSITSISGSNLISGMGSSSNNTNMLISQLIKRMFTPMKVGGIFILIAAVAVIAFLIVSIIKSKMTAGNYVGTAQAYPDPQYPNQPYPNQQYPNQPYPNQQYPNQQYPGQPYPGQVPSDAQPQNHNEFMPR